MIVHCPTGVTSAQCPCCPPSGFFSHCATPRLQFGYPDMSYMPICLLPNAYFVYNAYCGPTLRCLACLTTCIRLGVGRLQSWIEHQHPLNNAVTCIGQRLYKQAQWHDLNLLLSNPQPKCFSTSLPFRPPAGIRPAHERCHETAGA